MSINPVHTKALIDHLEKVSTYCRAPKLKKSKENLLDIFKLLTKERVSPLPSDVKTRLKTSLSKLLSSAEADKDNALIRIKNKILELQKSLFPSDSSASDQIRIAPSLTKHNRLEKKLKEVEELQRLLPTLKDDQIENFCLGLQLCKAYFNLAKTAGLIERVPTEFQNLRKSIESYPKVLAKLKTVIPHGLSNPKNDCCFISATQLLNWALDPSIKDLAPNFLGPITKDYQTLHSGHTTRSTLNKLTNKLFSRSGQEDSSEILDTIFDLYMRDNLPTEELSTLQPHIKENSILEEVKNHPATVTRSYRPNFLVKILNFFSSMIVKILSFLGIKSKNQPAVKPFETPSKPKKSSPKALSTTSPPTTKNSSEIKEEFNKIFGKGLDVIHNNFDNISHQIPEYEILEQSSSVVREGWNLHLPIALKAHETTINLEKALKKYSEKELLDDTYTEIGGVRYSHPKYREHLIEKAPKQLVISLKRFAYDKNTYSLNKIHHPIETDFENIRISGSLFENKQPSNYELKGFIQHLGASLESGHYVSYVKVQDQWFFCDDGSVTAVTTEDAILAAQNAYTLVLNKKHLDN